MPMIGLLSDSHGRAQRTLQAARLLAHNGAEILIHLGDLNTIQVFDALVVEPPTPAGSQSDTPGSPTGTGQTEEQGASGTSLSRTQVIPVHLVFGNTDYDVPAMTRYAQSLGLIVNHPMGVLTWGSTRLAFTHGHNHPLMEQALAQGVTYLCHGHTHVADDHRTGPTRVINPGALHRADRYTVALLDTGSDKLRFLEVE